jgi:hypothetical protein
VAEYGLLDGQLASIVAVAEKGDAAKIPEDILMDLASEIPDLRTRLGIGCTPFRPSLAFSPVLVLLSSLFISTLSQGKRI